MAGFAELFAAVHKVVGENWPGRLPLRITIHLHPGDTIELPVPPALVAPPAPVAFIPNAFQNAILDALDGKALRTTALAAALGGDQRRLFRKPGGIQELRDHGLVESHDRLGYFRPDAPPEELAER